MHGRHSHPYLGRFILVYPYILRLFWLCGSSFVRRSGARHAVLVLIFGAWHWDDESLERWAIWEEIDLEKLLRSNVFVLCANKH